MAWETGATFYRIIPTAIDENIAGESAERRTSIIAQILAAFALSGADVRELFGHSEDVDAALKSLGLAPKTNDEPFDPFTITIDLSRIGLPASYEFTNGPYDGSSFRLGTGLQENPPELLTLKPDPRSSRGNEIETYKFDVQHSYDDDGQPIDEEIGYFYVPSPVNKTS